MFAKYVYPNTIPYIIIDGTIKLGFRYDNITSNKNIITKYIFVLDTKLSNNFLLFPDIRASFLTFIYYFSILLNGHFVKVFWQKESLF